MAVFLGLAVRLRHCRRPVRVLGTGTVQSTEETEKKCMRARNKVTVVVYFVTAHCANPEENQDWAATDDAVASVVSICGQLESERVVRE
jgi:hypothetical protein